MFDIWLTTHKVSYYAMRNAPKVVSPHSSDSTKRSCTGSNLPSQLPRATVRILILLHLSASVLANGGGGDGGGILVGLVLWPVFRMFRWNRTWVLCCATTASSSCWPIRTSSAASFAPSFRRGRRLLPSSFVTTFSSSSSFTTTSTRLAMSTTKTVLVPIADGSEEIETSCITDTLTRFGAKVTVASVSSSLLCTMSRGLQIQADCTILDCIDQEWDLIALPGGMPGAEHLRDSTELINLLKRQQTAGKLYGAICAGTYSRWNT